MPLTPRSLGVTTSSRGEASSSSEPQHTIVRSLADWERKQELLEKQLVNGWLPSPGCMCSSSVKRFYVGAPRGLWCFDWSVSWLRSCFWLDNTERQHRERGMETESKRQDQWHQHCWRQHENGPKVCQTSALETKTFSNHRINNWRGCIFNLKHVFDPQFLESEPLPVRDTA